MTATLAMAHPPVFACAPVLCPAGSSDDGHIRWVDHPPTPHGMNASTSGARRVATMVAYRATTSVSTRSNVHESCSASEFLMYRRHVPKKDESYA